jgi:uncharacterized protein YceH (UPF0502 family)
MSTQPSWPVLDANERRVLGVLVEKAKTTPDSYPLSINALVTGCNQKSNREPVMSLTDLDVEDTLARLQKKGVVTRITGSRVERWRHDLYETWKLDKLDLALVGELLLRGPQTEGELRSHVSRMENFADLDVLRAALKPLVERGLVIYLTPTGRRGTGVTHGFHVPAELEQIRKRFQAGDDQPAERTSPAAAASVELEQRLQKAESEISRLTQEIAELLRIVSVLQEQNRSHAGTPAPAVERGTGVVS